MNVTLISVMFRALKIISKNLENRENLIILEGIETQHCLDRLGKESWRAEETSHLNCSEN